MLPGQPQRILEPLALPASPHVSPNEPAADFGLLRAVLDPSLNAVHVSLLRERPQVPLRTHQYLTALGDWLSLDGPFSLTPAGKRSLLWDADATAGVG